MELQMISAFLPIIDALSQIRKVFSLNSTLVMDKQPLKVIKGWFAQFRRNCISGKCWKTQRKNIRIKPKHFRKPLDIANP